MLVVSVQHTNVLRKDWKERRWLAQQARAEEAMPSSTCSGCATVSNLSPYRSSLLGPLQSTAWWSLEMTIQVHDITWFSPPYSSFTCSGRFQNTNPAVSRAGCANKLRTNTNTTSVPKKRQPQNNTNFKRSQIFDQIYINNYKSFSMLNKYR